MFRAGCTGRKASRNGGPDCRRFSLSASSMHPLHRRGGNSFNAYHGRLPAAHPRSGLDGRRGAVRGGGRAPDRAHYRGSSRNQASARDVGSLRLRAVGVEDSVRYWELFASYRRGVGGGAVRAECDGGLGSIVLLFQALLLAHGGITTLGANAFSMAIVGPWVAWTVWRLTSGFGRSVGVFWRRRWAIWRRIA